MSQCVAHVPTHVLASVLGENWFEVLLNSSPDAEVIIKKSETKTHQPFRTNRPASSKIIIDDDDDDDEVFRSIVYEGIEYKVDEFNDVFGPNMEHMGVLSKEDPINIEWAREEAMCLHRELKM